jgi:hypothetical protein
MVGNATKVAGIIIIGAIIVSIVGLIIFVRGPVKETIPFQLSTKYAYASRMLVISERDYLNVDYSSSVSETDYAVVDAANYNAYITQQASTKEYLTAGKKGSFKTLDLNPGTYYLVVVVWGNSPARGTVTFWWHAQEEANMQIGLIAFLVSMVGVVIGVVCAIKSGHKVTVQIGRSKY